MKESFFGGLLLGLALLGWCTLVWWTLIGGEKLIDYLKPEVKIDFISEGDYEFLGKDYHTYQYGIYQNEEQVADFSFTCESSGSLSIDSKFVK